MGLASTTNFCGVTGEWQAYKLSSRKWSGGGFGERGRMIQEAKSAQGRSCLWVFELARAWRGKENSFSFANGSRVMGNFRREKLCKRPSQEDICFFILDTCDTFKQYKVMCFFHRLRSNTRFWFSVAYQPSPVKFLLCRRWVAVTKCVAESPSPCIVGSLE